MGLETGNFISNLVASNPEETDLVNEGNNHIQLIKSVLKKTFPGSSGNGFNKAIIASEDEINRLDGVTSNIQAQINNNNIALQVLNLNIAYGQINSNGSLKNGTKNISSVNRLGNGHYRLTFSQSALSTQHQALTATPDSTLGARLCQIVYISASIIEVYTVNTTNGGQTLENMDFSVIRLKA